MEKDRAADGLRGLAAASVMVTHFSLAIFPLGLVSLYPWLASEPASRGVGEAVLSHPLLIALWNGHLPVCIFFVLSGYVLTKRFFATGDVGAIQSQAARRYFRLGIPLFFSVMFAYALIASGAYFLPQAHAITHSAWLTHNAVRGATLREALLEGSFTAILYNHYALNRVLWTMQIELIGSMMIFAYCLLAGGRHVLMSALYLVLAVAFAPSAWLYYAAFLAGAHIGRMKPPGRGWVVYLVLVAGYAVASAPMDAGLWQHIPLSESSRFPFVSVVGGAMVFYAVRFGALGAVLKSKPCQFLGAISYPLYLIHVPIILSLGCRAFVGMIELGNPRWASALVAFIACVAVTLPAAWIFERLVDRPTVRLGRMLAFTPASRAANGVKEVAG